MRINWSSYVDDLIWAVVMGVGLGTLLTVFLFGTILVCKLLGIPFN